MENSKHIYVVFYQTSDGFFGQKILATSKSDGLETFNYYFDHIIHKVLFISSYAEIIVVVEEIKYMPLTNKIELFEQNNSKIEFKQLKEEDVAYESSNGLLRDDLLEMFLDFIEEINIDNDDLLISDNFDEKLG